MIEATDLFRAGGLLPAAAGESGENVDTIDARTYTHAGLGERPVVRLVPSSNAAAEDLALEFIGLRLSNVDEAVAIGRRQALGFPGWALANDPANGAYALAVVNEMERFTRLARTRPGAARDGFEQLGERLARTVPHFLPTYYEQVGRQYIDAEQPTQATAMFSRAREAERTYGLELDEGRRSEVFLEFALAGALSGKAVDDYAEQLRRAAAPAEAYQRFRELCLQRTLGGVPPSTGMAEHLRTLAASAGLDAAAEARSFLQRIIDAPATALSSAGFWKASRTTLVELAREKPSIRGALLNLFPSPQPSIANFLDWWLDLLTATGAVDGLIQPAGQVPPEAEPRGGPAAWLSRLATQINHSWRRVQPAGLPGLVERMAPRLKADNLPADLIGHHAWRFDLDLLDLALELGIPLARPAAGVTFNLFGYDNTPHSRELLNLVEDEVFGPHLLAALESYLASSQTHADQLPPRAGMNRLIARWLDGVADLVEHGGLPQVETTLARLERSVSERSLGLNPAARARIAAADVASALGRTLRGGLLDELGWPALEEACASLQPVAGNGLRVAEAWPNLIVADGHRALVVGLDGTLLEHDLRIPSRSGRTPSGTAATSEPQFLYADAQLLVAWYDQSQHGLRAYWSARPDEVFDLKKPLGWSLRDGNSYELPLGGRTRGWRAIHAGDTALAEPAHVFTDGITFWRVPTDAIDASQLEEFEPVSGRAVRTSLPPFFEQARPTGAQLALTQCALLPVPTGLEASPLGMANGLLGWVTWTVADEPAAQVHGQRIDGRRFDGRLHSSFKRQSRLHGLATFPGDDAPRPIALNASQLSVWSPDGECELFRGSIAESSPLAPGTPIVLPPLFWHCLRPRDPAGSAALRCLSNALARQLLDAAGADHAAEQAGLPKTSQMVSRLLPDVTDARLRQGVVGVTAAAGRLARRLASLPALQTTLATPASIGRDSVTIGRDSVTDQHLDRALRGLFPDWLSGQARPGPSLTLQQIDVVSDVARGGDLRGSLPDAPIPWSVLLGHLGAIAYRAASAATDAEHREALLTLLEALADSPYLERVEQVRRAEVVDHSERGKRGYTSRILRHEGRLLFIKRGLRTWLLQTLRNHATAGQQTVMLLELSPDTRFELPSDCDLVRDAPVAPTWESTERLRSIVGLIRERGVLTWLPAHVERFASATGVSQGEAALLLLAAPGVGEYGRGVLDKPVREALGISTRDADAARDALTRVPVASLRAVLADALPEDPRELWDADRQVDRLAAAWVRHVGRRVRVAEALIRDMPATVQPPVPTGILAACADPANAPALNRDGRWIFVPTAWGSWQLHDEADDGQPVFEGTLLAALAPTYAWLFAFVPVGEPMRANLPLILERARARLSNTSLLIEAPYGAGLDAAHQAFDALPPQPVRTPSGKAIPDSRDAGALVAVRYGSATVGMFVRPASLLHADEAVARLLATYVPASSAARFLLGPDAAAMAARVSETPVPVGGFEANPLLSAAALVDEVARALDIAPEAAAAYLQVLTLARPTTRNLAAWNGWSTRQLAGVLDSLVERGLLVRGKRARAGREVFLPGPWDERRLNRVPMESWKWPLYEAVLPEGRVLPLRPVHEMFAAAWQRLQAGDTPQYEAS